MKTTTFVCEKNVREKKKPNKGGTSSFILLFGLGLNISRSNFEVENRAGNFISRREIG